MFVISAIHPEAGECGIDIFPPGKSSGGGHISYRARRVRKLFARLFANRQTAEKWMNKIIEGTRDHPYWAGWEMRIEELP